MHYKFHSNISKITYVTQFTKGYKEQECKVIVSNSPETTQTINSYHMQLSSEMLLQAKLTVIDELLSNK